MTVESVKTAIAVVSVAIGVSGLWFGIGKDVGANKAVVGVTAEVATARAETKALAENHAEFKGETRAEVQELKRSIESEGEKTRRALTVRNAGGR